MAGMLLAALDQTIVSTSIRTIADDLQGLSAQAWVTTAYLITSTVTTPLYGKLSDIYGRRPMFIIAISIFVFGSLLCTFATSMYELAAFRAVQGIGAGGLFSMALAILADIAPPRERAKYQGYFLAVFGMSSVVGPLVGGFFAGTDTHPRHRRLALGLPDQRADRHRSRCSSSLSRLHIPHIRTDHRIDWWGAAALISGMVPLLIVAEQGRIWGWTSAGVLGLIALGIVGVIAFILIEFRMKDEALIPMRLFNSRVFSIGLSVNVLIGLGMFGALSTLPLYLQLVKGATPTESGLLLIPMMIGIMGGSVLSGQLTIRTGKYKIFPVIGTAILAIDLLPDADGHRRHPVLAAGHLLPDDRRRPGPVYADHADRRAEHGPGQGHGRRDLVGHVLPAARRHPGCRGVPVAAVQLAAGQDPGRAAVRRAERRSSSRPSPRPLRTRTARATPTAQSLVAASQGNAAAASVIGDALSTDSSFLNTLDPAIARPFQVGYVDSTHLVYIIGGIIMALAFVLVIAMKELPLRTKSALDRTAGGAGREDAADAAEAADLGRWPTGDRREHSRRRSPVADGRGPSVEAACDASGAGTAARSEPRSTTQQLEKPVAYVPDQPEGTQLGFCDVASQRCQGAMTGSTRSSMAGTGRPSTST